MNYAPELIGVGRYTGEIGAYLVDQGHDVEVVTSTPHYPGWSVKAPFKNRYSVTHSTRLRIWRCPLLLPREMRGIWRVLAPLTFAITSAPVAVWRILSARPDTVLCVEPTLFSAPVALVAAKLVNAYTVLHVQDLEIDAAFAVGHLSGGRLKRLAHAFEAAVVKRFRTVITISDQMERRLRVKGVREERSAVIRNWVDTNKIRPVHGRNRFRDELGLSDQTVVALYAGNIGPKQALHVVLDAADRLKADPGIVFVIAGEGPERARLMARKTANVRFLPLQPEDRLSELLSAADIHILPQVAGAADLVLPSKLGGILASGRPLIVQAEDGTELQRFLDGAATIVPPADAGALADAIIARAPDTAIASECRRTLTVQLSAERLLARLEAILQGSVTSEAL